VAHDERSAGSGLVAEVVAEMQRVEPLLHLGHDLGDRA